MSSMRLCLSTAPPHEVCSCSNFNKTFYLIRHLLRQPRRHIKRKLLCAVTEPQKCRPRSGQVRLASGGHRDFRGRAMQPCRAAQARLVTSYRHLSARRRFQAKPVGCPPQVSCAKSRYLFWCPSPNQRCGDEFSRGVFRNRSSCRLGSRSGAPWTSSPGSRCTRATRHDTLLGGIG